MLERLLAPTKWTKDLPAPVPDRRTPFQFTRQQTFGLIPAAVHIGGVPLDLVPIAAVHAQSIGASCFSTGALGAIR
jgi:hypothetical protein